MSRLLSALYARLVEGLTPDQVAEMERSLYGQGEPTRQEEEGQAAMMALVGGP